MFTTFNVRNFRNGHQEQQVVDASASDIKFTGRARRSQVARACDLCRLNRTKCDNEQPCKNCRNRGAKCSNSGRTESRTLPAATREIDRLRSRVRELEKELDESRKANALTNGNLPSPVSSTPGVSPLPILLKEENPASARLWEGTWSNCVSSDQRQTFGPLSSFYFITRLRKFLGHALQHTGDDAELHPTGASKVFASPTGSRLDGRPDHADTAEAQENADNLPRNVEQGYLDLFWQTYHCTIPIIDEHHFRDHYDSLWNANSTQRKASPLVDIVVALCLQYGKRFINQDNSHRMAWNDVPSTDPSIAGGALYRRCQGWLTAELERPSISTVQCYVYSAIYLQNASFLNMAHNTLAVGIRTAYSLGLHHPPPTDIPKMEQEIRKRLWWALFAIETKASMVLGRAFMINMSQISVSLADDFDEASLRSAGTQFISPYPDFTFLTYQMQCIRMVIAARSVHSSFQEKSAALLANANSMYDSAESIEALAQHLNSSLHPLQKWALEIPKNLLLPHTGSSTEPFPPLRQSFVVSSPGPIWLQRQRLLLALRYHDLILSVYRPFIRFSSDTTTGTPPPASSTPFASGQATACLNHALTGTNLLYQALTETDLLAGWHEAYRFQWNAALALLGFLFANPINASTPSARKGVNTAISVFEIFGKDWAVASSAAVVVKGLVAKVDRLMGSIVDSGQNTPSSATSPSNALAPSSIESTTLIKPSPSESADSGIGMEGLSVDGVKTDPMQPTVIGDFTDWTMNTDWSDFDMLMADGNISMDLWPDFINNDLNGEGF